MFDSTPSRSTTSDNVERLANALVDGREVVMHSRTSKCGTAFCVLGWACQLFGIDGGHIWENTAAHLGLTHLQWRAVTHPNGFLWHYQHSPSVAQAAASELRRLHAGGEANPLWLQEALSREQGER